jgi:hypothetical protein
MPLLFGSRRKRFVRTDGQDTIVVRLTFEPKGIRGLFRSLCGVKFGQGKIKSMSCALARPFKQLFEEGKPIGRINYIFFKVNKWPSRVLGSLCLTQGQRLLFYPGLIERKVNWCFSKKESFRSIKSTGFVDHLTLEKGSRKWHVTILEPEGTKELRMPSYGTKEIHKNTFFWFGLTIQDLSVLEITPEELTLIFPSPPRDSNRRIESLMKARDRAIFHLATLNLKCR